MTDRNPDRSFDYLHRLLHPSPRELRAALGEVNGINAKIAVFVTKIEGRSRNNHGHFADTEV